VLLVIIIFLMLTTTYAKFSGLEINLPTADASKQTEPAERDQCRADGRRSGAGQQGAAGDGQRAGDQRGLRRAAGDTKEPVIVINADAKANYQSVVDIMQAAQAAGYPRISFATQSPH
jgi:biopolymer transport protein ExbD